MRRRAAVLGSLGVLAGWFGACTFSAGAHAGGISRASGLASHPVAVSVQVIGGQGTVQGAHPTVEVRVGNSAPVPVLLDTGSSGLRLFDTAVKSGPNSGVAISNVPSNITYAGGHRFTGVLATAFIRVGGQRTMQPVQFGLVQQVSCVPTKPKCPVAQGMSGFEKVGGFGILGIGTQSSGGGIVSPLLGMPGNLSDSWSLHLRAMAGQLILGASPPRSSLVVATLPMKQIGSAGGHPLWGDDRLPLCLTIGTASGCAPGLLDSGTYTMQVYGQPFAQVPTTARRVTSGVPVSVTVAGAPHPFWQFPAGTTKSDDLVTIRGSNRLFVNCGVQTFYDFTVTYNDLQGTVLLVPST
jgi:hypothetical protein